MNYLSNPICKFTPLYNVNYSNKKNIVSASFFKMKGGSYKNFSIYVNGITHLSNYINEYMDGFVLRLFIDESINRDEKIMNRLDSLKNVEIVKYECSKYLVDGLYHRGTFGTLIRFFPMFNFPNNDSDVVMISDIDWNSVDEIKKKNYMYYYYQQLKKYNRLDNHLFYHGRIFHEALHNKFFKQGKLIPYILASKIINKLKINNKVLLDFIGKLDKSQELLSNYIFTSENKQKIIDKSKNNKYIFGIDEYFLNHDLINYLISNNCQIAYHIDLRIIADIFFTYHRTDELSNITSIESKLYEIFFRYILKDVKDYHYKSLKQSFNILDEYLYIDKLNNNKNNETVMNILKNIYIFYQLIYNTKYAKYFNKDFLNIFLDKDSELFGYLFVEMYKFIGKINETIIVKSIKLPNKTIEIIKK